MNRIQQILEKAERDETVRGLSLREVAVEEAATAPYGAPDRYEPSEEAEADVEPFTAPVGSDARDFSVDERDRDTPGLGFDSARRCANYDDVTVAHTSPLPKLGRRRKPPPFKLRAIGQQDAC